MYAHTSLQLTCVDIDRSGAWFATGGLDQKVALWPYEEAGKGAKPSRQLYQGHAGRINKVVISDDGRRLVSVGAEGGVLIWRVGA